MSSIAYIALGGNLGDCRKTFQQALACLVNRWPITLVDCSSLYETESVGGPSGQPNYLNAAVYIKTRLSPHELLEALQDVERQHGRRRRVRWGPRTLDLDLLLYNEQVIHDEALQVPHPRLPERLFVLEPLSDIAPALAHPTLKESIAGLRNRCRVKGDTVRKIAGSEWVGQANRNTASNARSCGPADAPASRR